MFTKLRNRFLVLNLVIISFMMLVAFVSIYTITYQNVRSDIDMELHRIEDFYHKPDGGMGPKKGGGKLQPDFMNQAEPPVERSVSFRLQADGQWKLTATDSRFDMDSDFYQAALAKAAAASSGEGQFSLDGTRWAFLALPNGDGHSVVFLDVTAQRKFVTNLVYTFLAVGLAMLIVIYFTSRFFANRAIAPVREAFDKQKQFIADASHELKTPLAVIDTHADVLLANGEETIRSQAKWLHHIKSETERMKTLTNELLYLTRMDDARGDTLFSTINVSECVESVILTMEAVAYEKELTLRYDIEPNLTMRGSAEQIKQVVMILLDNAIKYAGPNGIIHVALKKRAHDTQLTVANTGEGIAAEHLGRIFDRFYRADASRSRQHGGYGLGLAIAKAIVEQHQGTITVRSVPGDMTTFLVQLP
ncbi:MAG: GHKL domain-containing protein [Paenibacillaceae bacterium]|nr:GHKL domain-containing protein [Paenibacillaceae bacterium]